MELRGYRAYTEILKAQSDQVKKQTQPSTHNNVSFADVLNQGITQSWQDTKSTLKVAEQSMMKAASGESIDPLNVVHNLSQAEMQFELMKTLQTKLLQIYQDISRMPL